MYDCSTKSFQENIWDVKTMADYAHRCGLSIEAELGHVGSNDGGAESVGENDNSIYTEPEGPRILQRPPAWTRWQSPLAPRTALTKASPNWILTG